ncbi:penicillin-binding transpeptidase domain-containing protein [uncultured Intestinimonas sp.]|uniref:penicillin-binding transpeptidase domain-containing protein n=1 Tax=uncultured Intestinimonas sp. TaxID=1689265 RepID=UPI0025F48B3C|nr:penicillin-binding transpeptidase domain-containing protein [uncultured Intestinimonas sp.]
MAQKERKNSTGGTDCRQNRTILGRTIFLMAVFGVLAFVPLLWKLWQIQIVDYRFYQEKAISQQTRDMLVTAPRGTIYDSQGNILAVSTDVYNVVISPKDILAAEETKAESGGKKAAKGNQLTDAESAAMAGRYQEFVAEGLAEILGVETDTILKRMENTGSQYEVLQWRVDDDVSTAVRTFQEENGLYPGVYLLPDTKRVYPYSSLAAQVIGWVNVNDGNRGAYGIEAKYEDLLAGEPGRVVTAKKNDGTEMLSSYESYVDAQPGLNVQLTIDATIQSYCEKALADGITSYEVRNGGFCIVMNPKTGAILAMASSPNYDLNQPRSITDPVLAAYLEKVQNDPSANEDAYAEALQEAQYTQWTNRVVTDTYEPGSTFKIMVLAAALEEGVVNQNSHFYCPGYKIVADRRISCSKHEGHGGQTLAQAVANSCNPAFIEIGQALGAEKFYQYLLDFGIIGKTGIDIQGEADNTNLVWTHDYFTGIYGEVSLATASFGQTFRLTPIQLITAASAAVNGGHLMQPYVVQALTDQEGNVVEQTEPTEVRQVVSESTSAMVREMLYGVVNGGTGKNANVEGYRIGGKTGTSEKRDEDTGDLIVSFLGVAPADDPQIVVLIAFDSPTPVVPGSDYTSHGFYISGGNMGALSAGSLIADILDYLGVEKVYSDSSYADVVVPNAVGLSQADAIKLLQSKGLGYRVVGDGAAVTDQLPAQGVSIPGKSEVVLYLGAEKPTEQVSVPDLIRMTASAAEQALEKLGLYMRPIGVTDYSDTTIATEQSITAGTMVDPGTVVEVQFMDTAVQDYAAIGNISNIH